MSTFVLVHGAWHGGWCWREVRQHLEGRGHVTFAPTLTGLGERKHHLDRDVTVEVMVRDIAHLLEYERLEDVVLVGHSFAGVLLSPVAELVRDRLQQLVFLDAAILEDGESMFDMMDPDVVEKRRLQAEKLHEGLALGLPGQNDLGIEDDGIWSWVEPLLTPHPISSYETRVRLKAKPGEGIACEYIQCTRPEYGPLSWARERARGYGWPIRDIETGHDAMLTAPQALADMLASERNHT